MQIVKRHVVYALLALFIFDNQANGLESGLSTGIALHAMDSMQSFSYPYPIAGPTGKTPNGVIKPEALQSSVHKPSIMDGINWRNIGVEIQYAILYGLYMPVFIWASFAGGHRLIKEWMTCCTLSYCSWFICIKIMMMFGASYLVMTPLGLGFLVFGYQTYGDADKVWSLISYFGSVEITFIAHILIYCKKTNNYYGLDDSGDIWIVWVASIVLYLCYMAVESKYKRQAQHFWLAATNGCAGIGCLTYALHTISPNFPSAFDTLSILTLPTAFRWNRIESQIEFALLILWILFAWWLNVRRESTNYPFAMIGGNSTGTDLWDIVRVWIGHTYYENYFRYKNRYIDYTIQYGDWYNNYIPGYNRQLFPVVNENKIEIQTEVAIPLVPSKIETRISVDNYSSSPIARQTPTSTAETLPPQTRYSKAKRKLLNFTLGRRNRQYAQSVGGPDT